MGPHVVRVYVCVCVRMCVIPPPLLPTLSRSCEVDGFGGHLPAFQSVSLPRLSGLG